MGIIPFHRAQLLEVLVQGLDKERTKTHFSKRLVSYALPEKRDNFSPITLTFKDGSTATCDVLIGCDGIHSRTRHVLYDLAAKDAEETKDEGRLKEAATFRSYANPVWSGFVAHRSVFPRELLEKRNPNHRALELGQSVSNLPTKVNSVRSHKRFFSTQYMGKDKVVRRIAIPFSLSNLES